MISDVTRIPGAIGWSVVLFIWVLLFSPTAYTESNTILVYGDSISAAYGMEQDEGWAALLAERLKENELPYSVVNASVSGETSGGGLVRLPKALDVHEPGLVILELGGNDGLRGYPISKIEENLDEMTRMILETGARVLLVGMVLPPNYGRRYIEAFTNVFPTVAERHDVPLIPVLLDGIATAESLIQRDGIHPKPEAQPLIVEQVWPVLVSMLEEVELQGSVVGDQ